jgi:integrase/recombinase XerD
MNDLQILIDNYLEYCKSQKRLDSKTINAYRIDLRQFSEQNITQNASSITSDMLENYVATLHQKYKPYTIIMFPLQKVRHHNRNRSFQNACFSIYHLAPPIRLPHPNTDSHLHLSLIHLCQSKSPSTE